MDKTDFLVHNVAVNLKRIRTARKMSLDELSEQTGVSKSMLGQIERGESNPTISVLGKIVSGLRVEFNDLIEEPPQEAYVVDHAMQTPSKQVPGEYSVYTYFPFEKKRNFEIYVIEIEPGGCYVSGSHGEKTTEYIIGVEGILTLETGGREYMVKPQDALLFESDKEHRYKNQTSDRVRIVSVFTFLPKF